MKSPATISAFGSMKSPNQRRSAQRELERQMQRELERKENRAASKSWAQPTKRNLVLVAASVIALIIIFGAVSI